MVPKFTRQVLGVKLLYRFFSSFFLANANYYVIHTFFIAMHFVYGGIRNVSVNFFSNSILMANKKATLFKRAVLDSILYIL